VREALFSALEVWLGGPGSLTGARVLDLYAGSGALGIEALSRGGSGAVFVEKDPEALRVLEGNLERLGLSDRSRVMRGGAVQALRHISASGLGFDAVLIDPPFTSPEPDAALAIVADSDLLRPGGIVVVEHPAAESCVLPEGFGLLRSRAYGTVALSFLRRLGEGETQPPSRPENRS
jgi:16S rRNA (guanine966-N2)-methyltransferase